MTIIKEAYVVEFTSGEIKHICDCLHRTIMAAKLGDDETRERYEKAFPLEKLRAMRNELGKLIGRSWVGADA